MTVIVNYIYLVFMGEDAILFGIGIQANPGCTGYPECPSGGSSGACGAALRAWPVWSGGGAAGESPLTLP